MVSYLLFLQKTKCICSNYLFDPSWSDSASEGFLYVKIWLLAVVILCCRFSRLPECFRPDVTEGVAHSIVAWGKMLQIQIVGHRSQCALKTIVYCGMF